MKKIKIEKKINEKKMRTEKEKVEHKIIIELFFREHYGEILIFFVIRQDVYRGYKSCSPFFLK